MWHYRIYSSIVWISAYKTTRVHKINMEIMWRWLRRWTHITSQCPRTLCYIPRPEDWTNSGVNAAFRHTKNVGFQDCRNFGAHNQHHSLWHSIPSPGFTSACYQYSGAGFGSEVVANLSSGWIFTSWRV